jgi:GNAT superfamily N-acetyltransferase
MFELTASQFLLTAHLFQAAHYGVLAAGTIEGGHPGRVFIDRIEQPRAALLCTRVGYYFLAGQPHVYAFNAWLPGIFSQELAPQQACQIGDSQVLLFYPTPAWRAPLLAQFRGQDALALRKKRMVLAPHANTASINPLPTGMHLQEYDQGLLEQKPELGGEAVLFYGSITAFLTHSLGVAVLDTHGNVASTCHAVFTGGGEAEISIATAQQYRRQGLARHTATAFISACRRRRLTPVWGCFLENTPSIALANDLGFREDDDQEFYLFQHLNGGAPTEIPSTKTATA